MEEFDPQAHKTAIKYLDQTRKNLLEKRRQLVKYQTEYNELRQLLVTLPNEISQPAMIPFGPLAFMPGEIVHTNEIMVLLGDNYFVERSAFQARAIISRRLTYVQKQIEDIDKNLENIEIRLGITQEILDDTISGLGEEGQFVEIREEYVSSDEEEEGSAKSSTVSREREVVGRVVPITPANLVGSLMDKPLEGTKNVNTVSYKPQVQKEESKDSHATKQELDVSKAFSGAIQEKQPSSVQNTAPLPNNSNPNQTAAKISKFKASRAKK